jgi:hypothetical protein
MLQSLSEMERAFIEEAQEEQVRAVHQVRNAEIRLRRRELDRVHKHGTMRFAVLVLTLIATAELVTVAMFETLYYVMG